MLSDVQNLSKIVNSQRSLWSDVLYQVFCVGRGTAAAHAIGTPLVYLVTRVVPDGALGKGAK